MFDLSGQSALVTGASGGIGAAIARGLHGQGATVALSGTRAAALESLAAELGERVRMKDEDWDQVIEVNLTAGFRLCRAAVKGMMKRRHGRIIGITSVVGVTGNAGQGNYAAAKAGMVGMTKALAQEVATRGITANCVAPGFIETAMTDVLNDKQREGVLSTVPMARLGTPDEIAAACVFLASREAAYVTGQTLHVNGGMAMI
jgi:3-oxoacyl-[acyl-carrier protein] reductase